MKTKFITLIAALIVSGCSLSQYEIVVPEYDSEKESRYARKAKPAEAEAELSIGAIQPTQPRFPPTVEETIQHQQQRFYRRKTGRPAYPYQQPYYQPHAATQPPYKPSMQGGHNYNTSATNKPAINSFGSKAQVQHSPKPSGQAVSDNIEIFPLDENWSPGR